MIGDGYEEEISNEEKLSFKRATLLAIMKAHCSNKVVFGYGTNKEVSIFKTN